MATEQNTQSAPEKTEAKKEGAAQKGNPKKTARKQNFLLYLFYLMALTIGSAVAVYYWTPVVLMSLTPHSPVTIKRTVEKQQIISETAEISSQQLPISDTEQTTNETIIPEIDEQTELITEEITLFNEPETTIPLAQETTTVQSQEPHQESSLTPTDNRNTSYSILKAMQLREALKNGEECRPLLEELMLIPNKTQELDKTLISLLKLCLDHPAKDQMHQAFYSAKRRAIFRIFQTENPTYLAYLKALPYFLADIRKKNPTNNTPMDILDRIQIAVEEDRPQLVLQLIPELPSNVQATLNDVAQHAEAETVLYQTFNHLMKILFDGEDKK